MSSAVESTPKYRVVALDLDGTTLNGEHKISDENKAAIRKLREKGVDVALCTGRMTSRAEPYEEILDVDSYLISYNGAVAHGNRQKAPRPLVAARPLSAHLSSRVIDFGLQEGLSVNFYHEEKVHSVSHNDSHKALIDAYQKLTSCTYEIIDNYDHLRDISPPKILIMVEKEKVAEVATKVRALLNDEPVHIIEADFFIEFLADGAHKGTAVKALCDHLGLDISQAVGFGDGNNDAEFLKTVGHGVAMKNASDHCKKHADKVSEWTNVEHAVAKELELLFFSDSSSTS